MSDDRDGKPVAFRGGGFAPKSRRWVGLVVFVLDRVSGMSTKVLWVI